MSETGIKQKSNDPSSQTHDWGEWQFYPAPVVQNFYDTQAGTLTTGTTYSIKLRNGTGNSWDLYIAHTTEPGSSWNHVDNTGNLSAFWGTPESELSRYGTADANDDVPLVPAGARQLPRLMGRLAAHGMRLQPGLHHRLGRK